ncbi:ATP-binding protein [Streptomyces sp. YC504]|uniref:ATP-binding protein n=1 Tax=Streptomyces mesophilus TaxID=1775132 RepID=A0A6G4XEZ6_9ACTN|nr:ATP-binding protein [Streptomyces mesophilus]NGO75968.1 ATP-binding protein [Streptomyces mesophilus]
MPPEPYATSLDHLYDELSRVELAVRAQVERWRRAVGELRDEAAWGTGILDDREVRRYLGHPYTAPLTEADTPEAVRELQRRAMAQTLTIGTRRALTTPSTLRLERLRSALGLTQDDVDVILVCLLDELDGRYRRLFAYLADERWLRSPTIGLLAEILRPAPPELPDFRARFAPDAPLIRHQLVRLDDDSRLSSRSVRLDARIAAYLTGQDYLDGRLAEAVRIAEPLRWDDLVLGDERRTRLQGIGESCRGGRDRIAVVALIGDEGSGRSSAARCLATQLGVELLLVDATAAAASGPDSVSELYREALLRGAAVMWRGCSHLAGLPATEDRTWATLLTYAALHPKPTFVDHLQPWDPAERSPGGGAFVRLSCPSPDLDERRAIWSELLGDKEVADRLAATFLLTPGRMLDAIEMSAELARQRGAAVSEEELRDACRRQCSRRLMSIARPIEAPAHMTLDDIVLPDANLRQLKALRDRVANRSRFEQLVGSGRSGPKGLVAMFAGSSGTGKTLAAGLLAKDLGRDLLKVDLAQVVSKWVGETEKNLDRVLNDAQDAHAILFFDEAEAIFGKRGTVSDARDRYALQETSFLLQRIEEYEGVVILATNLRQNLDDAFSRRIHMTIEFPALGEEDRERMWRLALSGVGHELTDEDLARVAKASRLSAAAIVQVVEAATFAAVARTPETPRLTADDVDDAVRAELQRVGLPAPPGSPAGR